MPVMPVVIPLLASYIMFGQVAPEPCPTLQSRAGFLQGVVDGLPLSIQQELCPAEPNVVTVSPDQTGVSHFVLPGFIPKALLGETDQGWKLVTHHDESDSESPDSEAAVMQLWLRAMCTGEETIIRGFGMLQGKANSGDDIHGQFELDLQLRSLPDESHQKHDFKIFWRGTPVRFLAPFTVELTIPFANTLTRYRIVAGGFHQLTSPVFTPEVSGCHAAFERKVPALLTVIPHSYMMKQGSPSQLELVASPSQLELVANVLAAHVNHHLKLGLIGTVHYEVEPYLSYLAKNAEIQLLIHRGLLRLIRWDLETQLEHTFGILFTRHTWHKNKSKVLQYNHAMLAHWGKDVYMAALDNDDLLATNQPTSVSKMLEDGCLVKHGYTTDFRYDIRCGSCQGNESDLWRSTAIQNPLERYNETDWRVRLNGKPIFHVDNSFSMHIHDSGQFSHGNGPLAQHTSYCFFHIHIVNLYGNRRDSTDTDFTDNVSWNWVLNQTHG